MKKLIRLLPLVFIALIALIKSKSIVEILVISILIVIGIVETVKNNVRIYLCWIENTIIYFYKNLTSTQTWWYLFEKSMKSGRPGKPMTCDQYTPAYPGKVLPQC